MSRHELPSGTVVERLPLGRVSGTDEWSAAFVLTAPPGGFHDDADGRTILPRIWPGAGADLAQGGGSVTPDEATWTLELRITDAAALDITYVDTDPTAPPTQVRIPIPAGTPAGQHRVTLPDGSVVERMPIGRAAGRWWLRFVRTGVPMAELDRYRAYDDAVDAALDAGDFQPDIDPPYDAPHERFLALRDSAGALRAERGGHTEGGPQQSFDVAVPAAGLTWLDVDYLHDGVVVATERLDLGPG